MSTALKKITARVKQLRKKHPGAKYKSLQKQAGKEFKAGKLKTRKKRAAAPKKRKTVKRRRIAGKAILSGTRKTRRKSAKRKTTRRRRVATVTAREVHTVKVTGRKKRRSPRRKSVGSPAPRRTAARKKSISPLLVIGAGLAIGYLLTRPKTPSQVAQSYIPIQGNQVANQSANNLITAATAAGATATAIANLIKQLNNSDANTIIATGGNPAQAAQNWQQWAQDPAEQGSYNV